MSVRAVYVMCQVPGYAARLGRIEPRRLSKHTQKIQYVQMWKERGEPGWAQGLTGYHKKFIRFATAEEIKEIVGHDERITA